MCNHKHPTGPSDYLCVCFCVRFIINTEGDENLKKKAGVKPVTLALLITKCCPSGLLCIRNVSCFNMHIDTKANSAE